MGPSRRWLLLALQLQCRALPSCSLHCSHPGPLLPVPEGSAFLVTSEPWLAVLSSSPHSRTSFRSQLKCHHPQSHSNDSSYFFSSLHSYCPFSSEHSSQLVIIYLFMSLLRINSLSPQWTVYTARPGPGLPGPQLQLQPCHQVEAQHIVNFE